MSTEAETAAAAAAVATAAAAAIARGDAVDGGAAAAAATATTTAADEAAVAAELAKGKTGDVKTGDDKTGDDKTGDANRDAAGKFAKKDNAPIPKDRFDEAVGRERNARLAAEIKAAELQATIDKAAKDVDAEKIETEIQGLEAQHTKLLLEGKGEDATKVMREIRMKERDILAIKNARQQDDATAKSAQERAIAEERTRVDSVIASLQEAHHELDEGHAEFNQKLVNVILAEQVRLIRDEGMAPSAALTKAATDVMELRGAKPQTLNDADKDGDKGQTPAEKAAAARKAEATAKALAAAKAQGKDLKDIGEDSTAHGTDKTSNEDVAQMSVEELSALPEATKARLRGDFL